jgi:hypothetical protein
MLLLSSSSLYSRLMWSEPDPLSLTGVEQLWNAVVVDAVLELSVGVVVEQVVAVELAELLPGQHWHWYR